MQSERTLIVGLRRLETEELKAWLQARGRRAWFTENAAGAMRVAEEIHPTRIVVDSGIDDMDVTRLVRIMRHAIPGLKATIIAGHMFEARQLASETALGPPHVQLRPIDPLALIGESVDARENSGEGVDTMEFAETVAKLVREQRSAALYLSDGLQRKILYITNGRMRFCSSNHFEEIFGRFLLRMGVVTQVDLDWARQLQLTEGVQQGEALQKIGIVRENDLHSYLKLQIREKFVRAFATDPTTHWRVAEGTQFTPHNDGYVLSAVDILTEALRQHAGDALPSTGETASLYLRLNSPIPEDLANGLRTMLPEDARRLLVEGAPLAKLAEAARLDDRGLNAFVHALDLLGMAETTSELGADERAVLAAVLGETAETDNRSVTEKVTELRSWLANARADDPFALLRIPRSAGREEVRTAADQLIERFGHPDYASQLPLEASMELAELLDAVRRARELLLDPTQRERAQRRIRHTMPMQALDGTRAENLYREGRALMEGGSMEECVVKLADAVQLDGTSPDYRVWYGWALHQTAKDDGERDHAKRTLLRVLDRHPDFADAYFLLGRMEEREGDAGEAAEQFRMALSFNSEHEEARAALETLEG